MPDYTPELIEQLLLEGPSHHLDSVELACDVERAFTWFCLEYPTNAVLIKASIQGYTLEEIAVWQKTNLKLVERQLRESYTIMAIWLNG